jgi:hypothetical protein
MKQLLKIILSPFILLKVSFAIILVFVFWMLECVLQIVHYAIDTPLRFVLGKIENLIKLLIKHIK